MKKMVAVATMAGLLLQGCYVDVSVDEESWKDLAKDVNEFNVLATTRPDVYPEHLTDSGKKYFGDGYDPDAKDLLSQIERRIWDMPDREDVMNYERLYRKKFSVSE